MKVSLLALLALSVSALNAKPKPSLEKKKTLGSGPGEVCEISPNFKREVNPKSQRKWELLSGPVTLEQPKLTKIFYINLDNSPVRKNETEANLAIQFPGVPVERWRATEKKEAGYWVYKDKNSSFYHKAKTEIGIIATWFSHYFLIKHISEMEDPNAVYLIFEDDVMMKRPGLQHNVMCQITQLPADWDLFKFGYWGYRMKVAHSQVGYPNCGGPKGEQINPYTCHQKGFEWNYMGNQGYALRPGGAKAIRKKLEMTQIMDVDGAMMPGGHEKTEYSHPNMYVSKHTLIQHSWRHTSTRTEGGEEGMGKKKSLMASDVHEDELPLSTQEEETVDKLEKEAADLKDDDSGRETGSQEFRRLMAWKETVLDKYS